MLLPILAGNLFDKAEYVICTLLFFLFIYKTKKTESQNIDDLQLCSGWPTSVKMLRVLFEHKFIAHFIVVDTTGFKSDRNKSIKH